MNTTFNYSSLTPTQKKWLEKHNITNCIQLEKITFEALTKWQKSLRGSKERKEAWTTYNYYCKKIFPKVNMNYYSTFIH